MKTQKYILFVLLSAITAMCAWIWAWADVQYTTVVSDNGTWDLREADFLSGNFSIAGEVEYIANALLTPEEFEARRHDIVTGRPETDASFSTSRIRILVPPGTYGLMGYSSEYASRIYISGILSESVGSPGSAADNSEPMMKLLFYTANAPDGMIEIVQQASNYVYREGDSHANIIIGTPQTIREIYTKQITLASVMMGCYFALALAHLVLYLLLRSYKANLWFLLFCAIWFVRTGLTGPKILTLLLPLDWYMAFRLEYLTVPAGTLLVCLTLNALFPKVLNKWFRPALAAACGVCACLCLFMNTVFMSEMMRYFYIVVFLSAAYIIIRLCMKLRKPDAEQIAVLIGMGIFLYSALRDILYFVGISVFPFAERSIAEVALLIFVFIQMASMLQGTMQEIAEAKEAEQILVYENMMLRRLNEMAESRGGKRHVFEHLSIDSTSTRAYWDSTDMRLAPKEYALLWELIHRRGEFVTSAELYEKVWGMPHIGDDHTVRSQIYNLRKKINEAGGRITIEQERNKGYKLVFYS